MESLADRRWIRKLFFNKIILGLLPSYLKDYLIPCDNLRKYLTRSSTQKRIKAFPARTKLWIILLSTLCWSWGNLSEEIRTINSRNTFKSSILNFVTPKENSVFEVYDIKGVKLLTRLIMDFSRLNEHKFRHNFDDIINPMCSCGEEPETTLYYLLNWDLYSIYRLELLNYIYTLNWSLKNSSEQKGLKILLYGAEDFTSQMNFEILKFTIKFIKKQIALVALYFFSSFPFSLSLSLFLSLTKYLVFNIFYMYFMFLCSIYVSNLQ